MIQPKDAAIMVDIVNAISTGVRRPLQFFHLPVPKPRTDDAFFAVWRVAIPRVFRRSSQRTR